MREKDILASPPTKPQLPTATGSKQARTFALGPDGFEEAPHGGIQLEPGVEGLGRLDLPVAEDAADDLVLPRMLVQVDQHGQVPHEVKVELHANVALDPFGEADGEIVWRTVVSGR
ncbi:hypothetical protein [Paracraurococcus ruber]|uniref:hypothetical protein n=1 Tax=Paracraurococcus ruber TaxID=77675 RepID=UPI0013054362|nr:hypothetical protein [Paracraurococcus ruber]